MKLAEYGEKRAKAVLKRHFTNVRNCNKAQNVKNNPPFDYTGIDKLTGERIAIEVKTIKRDKGKLAHIETEAMNRKLQFLNDTNRKGIVMIIIVNGETNFYFAKLQQHISKGCLIEIL